MLIDIRWKTVDLSIHYSWDWVSLAAGIARSASPASRRRAAQMSGPLPSTPRDCPGIATLDVLCVHLLTIKFYSFLLLLAMHLLLVAWHLLLLAILRSNKNTKFNIPTP